MQIIYENLGIIIGFSILVLLVQNFISEEASEAFVLMVLVSVLLVNAEPLANFLKFK